MKSCSRPWCCASQTPCTRTEPVSDRRPFQTARAQTTSAIRSPNMGFITLQSHHRPVTILSYGASAATAATNSHNPYRHTSPVCRQFLPASLYL